MTMPFSPIGGVPAPGAMAGAGGPAPGGADLESLLAMLQGGGGGGLQANPELLMLLVSLLSGLGGAPSGGAPVGPAAGSPIMGAFGGGGPAG